MRSLVIGLLLLCGQGVAQETAVSTEAVRGEYSITFPPDWEVGEGWTDEEVYALAPMQEQRDHFRENVNILVDDEVGKLTLEEYYDISLKGLKMLATDFKLDKSGETEIGGHPAKYLVFTHRVGIYALKVLQYMILVEGRAYLITATATVEDFPKFEAQFKKVASTFRLA